jgi:hypothetical protein
VLAETASNIFIALGNSDRVAKVVGHRISTAYQLADQAQNAFQSGNRSDEREGYRQACESLENAALLLGLPPGVAVSQVKWWHRYRHKQKLAVIQHVLMQHMHHINLRGVLLLPLIIDAMLQIGRALIAGIMQARSRLLSDIGPSCVEPTVAAPSRIWVELRGLRSVWLRQGRSGEPQYHGGGFA